MTLCVRRWSASPECAVPGATDLVARAVGCALQIYLVAILGACGGGTEAELSFAVAVVSLALAANIASAGLWLVLIASACCWSSALDDQSFARRCVVPCVIVCAVPIHALELALTVAGTWLIAWSSLAGACDGTWLIALVLLAGSWLRLVCARLVRGKGRG